MLRTKTVNRGDLLAGDKTVALYEFRMEEGASVAAPEGMFAALTVNGIGKPLEAPVTIRGHRPHRGGDLSHGTPRSDESQSDRAGNLRTPL